MFNQHVVPEVEEGYEGFFRSTGYHILGDEKNIEDDLKRTAHLLSHNIEENIGYWPPDDTKNPFGKDAREYYFDGVSFYVKTVKKQTSVSFLIGCAIAV